MLSCCFIVRQSVDTRRCSRSSRHSSTVEVLNQAAVDGCSCEVHQGGTLHPDTYHIDTYGSKTWTLDKLKYGKGFAGSKKLQRSSYNDEPVRTSEGASVNERSYKFNGQNAAQQHIRVVQFEGLRTDCGVFTKNSCGFTSSSTDFHWFLYTNTDATNGFMEDRVELFQ